MLLKAYAVQAATVGSNTVATTDKAVSLIPDCGTCDSQPTIFPESFVGGYPHGARFGAFFGGSAAKGQDDIAAQFDSAIRKGGAMI